jgi:predicted alpha-1,6-mannanase (GH76 family)
MLNNKTLILRMKRSIVLLITVICLSCSNKEIKDYKKESSSILNELMKWYNAETGLWETTSWWNAANAHTAITNYIKITGDSTYLKQLFNTIEICKEFTVPASEEKEAWVCKNFINDYYDDQAWWILALVNFYELTEKTQYLDIARITFEEMTTGWTGEGGIYWKKPKVGKWAAVQNELFMLCALKLNKYSVNKNVNGKTYLDWAKETWHWFENSGLIQENYTIENGLNKDKEPTQGACWTYNQGVILSVLIEFKELTGDNKYIKLAENIAQGTIKNLTINGILREQRFENLNGDATQFKGIFMRHLANLYQVTKNKIYKNFIIKNAESVLNIAKDKESFKIGSHWYEKFDKADASRQSSALDLMNAAIAVR